MNKVSLESVGGIQFSVLMSVYHRENPEHLEQSLRSLLKQTLQADEVVLVEDGPIGRELASIIESYRAKLNIVSVRLTQHSGLAVALNEGLKQCAHDLVARMDTDDFALPERFEKQVSFMKANPEIAISSCSIEEYDSRFDRLLYRRILPLTHNELYELAKFRNPINHTACIFRKQVILQLGGYPEIYPEDYMLWIKMLQNGARFANLPDSLMRVRTGEQFFKRRGRDILKGELRTYRYMYDSGFISVFEYVKNSLSRTVLRTSPHIIKSLLYRLAR
jgi:glycosyltransferase involved in cell wall biosynthesis